MNATTERTQPAVDAVRSRRQTPLAIIVLLPVTAAIIWWIIDAGSVLPPEEQALYVQQAELLQGPDEASGRAVTLPHDWRGRFPGGEGWYRFALDLQVPPNRLWAVLIPRVEQNAHLYLNGELVGGSGAIAPYPSRLTNRPLYFRIPNGLLRPGANTFEVQVGSYPAGRGFLDAVLIGPDEVLAPAFARRYFVQVDLLWLFLAGSISMTAVIGLLAWLRPRDTVYRWMAAVSGCWSLLSFLSLVVEPVVPGYWIVAGQTIASTGFCASAFLFGLRFVGSVRPVLDRLIVACALFGVIATLLAALLAPALVPYLRAVSPGLQMLIGPFVLAHLVRRYVATRDPDLFLLLYAGAVLVVFGQMSWLSAAGVSSAIGARYLYYATPLILVVVGALMLRRFVAALDASEQWADTLETRVAEKSAELQQNHARLAALEQQWALARERERIMRDMHDGVGGHLVASLSRLRDSPSADPPLRETLENALIDLRLMIDSLEGEDGDLNVALGMLRNRLQSQLAAASLQMRWDVPELPVSPRWTPDLILQVMRIVQEAITNVIKHAGASIVSLRAEAQGNDVLVTIADDGCGLSDGAASTQGRGLRNMVRRAELIGARLDVRRAVQVPHRAVRGTEVVLRIPG
ncbi:MAG: hypothetical protein KF911_01745 [Pseudomonadales bacterium]|nr:hypothetical protein [Pseudomonadales bacterium]